MKRCCSRWVKLSSRPPGASRPSTGGRNSLNCLQRNSRQVFRGGTAPPTRHIGMCSLTSRDECARRVVCHMRIFRTIGGFAFASAVLLCCASIQNDPVNVPGTPNTLANRLGLGFKESEIENDVVIGL